jgi:hypothetical protein
VTWRCERQAIKELGKNRENLVATFQKRGFVYMLNRSTGSVARRKYRELLASLYNSELCFVRNLECLDKTATEKFRLAMGEIPALLRAHTLLLQGIENCLSTNLCVGPTLKVRRFSA